MTHPARPTLIGDDFFLACPWCDYEIKSKQEPGPSKTAAWYHRMSIHITSKHVKTRPKRGFS